METYAPHSHLPVGVPIPVAVPAPIRTPRPSSTGCRASGPVFGQAVPHAMLNDVLLDCS